MKDTITLIMMCPKDSFLRSLWQVAPEIEFELFRVNHEQFLKKICDKINKNANFHISQFTKKKLYLGENV